ncbi:unnamed protein product [Soboliphyme baturini]|uniref:Dynein light intermediate chain n=1 Tax=Soboliphyme baturini TaxID=241478 RepID=A0A183IQ38_9BILA|nr:unnamed protein product [Soboliphyme baturini]
MPVALNEEENLWSRILDEVRSKSTSNLPESSVLVLGDNESGKTSLVARLQGIEDPKKGFGLEYHYLDIHPDYKNGSYAYQLSNALPDVSPGESSRLGVWVLDGNPIFSHLIKFALTKNLDHCVTIICCSMAEPWSILDSLNRWVTVLRDHVENSGLYDADLLRDCQERQKRFWQEYVEPLDSSSHNDFGSKVPSMETEQILLPLGESALIHNIGLPLIVVMTKDELFDFILMHVRKFCLNYGAALAYTSVKETRHCETLYKYILHRVYGFPFTQPAFIPEKDSIFIPAGWDNEKKIGILCENLISFKPEDSFEEHVKKPAFKRPMSKDALVQAEDDQVFLSKLQVLLTTPTTPSSQTTPTTHRQVSEIECTVPVIVRFSPGI